MKFWKNLSLLAGWKTPTNNSYSHRLAVITESGSWSLDSCVKPRTWPARYRNWDIWEHKIMRYKTELDILLLIWWTILTNTYILNRQSSTGQAGNLMVTFPAATLNLLVLNNSTALLIDAEVNLERIRAYIIKKPEQLWSQQKETEDSTTCLQNPIGELLQLSFQKDATDNKTTRFFYNVQMPIDISFISN